MAPVSKRITRSNSGLKCASSIDASISTSSAHQTNIHSRAKRLRTNRRVPSQQPLADVAVADLSTERMETVAAGEYTYATLEPVPFDLPDSAFDPPASPPALVIDTSESVNCLQSKVTEQITTCSQSAPIEQPIQRQTDSSCDPYQTPIQNNRILINSRNTTFVPSGSDCSLTGNQREMSIASRTAMIRTDARTPDVERTTPHHFPRPTNDSIVVSADRFRKKYDEQNIYSNRTSTPRPSSQTQLESDIVSGYDDSFCLDSIPPETKSMLSRFSEFRRLAKAYKSERQKCKVWMNDYARLKKKYDQLEQNSFPRPPAAALSFLVDLVTHIQQSGGDRDLRTDDQLAADLGMTLVKLTSLKDTSPQQTGLNFFNFFYPGYEAKTKLDSIDNLEISRPGLLGTILVICQRVAPGVAYQINDLRDTLSNSIRGARYTYRKKKGNISDAVAFLDEENIHQSERPSELTQNTSFNRSSGVGGTHSNARRQESIFDHEEIF